MGDGTKFGDRTEEVSFSLVDDLFFNRNVLLPMKIAIFADFDGLITWGKVNNVVSSSGESVIDEDTGAFRFGSSRKKAGGLKGWPFVVEIDLVATSEDGDNIGASNNKNKDGRHDQ